MKTPTRKRQLTAEETAECAALKAIYAEKKKALKLTQDELGDRLGGIGQSGVSHYLNGVNALNIEAASGFARELQVPVSAFSPRLAAEIARIAQAAPETSAPGPDATQADRTAGGRAARPRKYQGDKYEKAAPEHRQAVDELADHMLGLTPEQALKLKQAMELLMPADDTRKD
ncbi:helix-turn-helix domain-containing protein [Azotobacter beijerinckii]|uniref:helix-turn-helix domain-containing protein n=1 Tax=Azotobacter beijerinckii TaxID=170623 RepID=UPI000B88E631|nr:helix-turn-helix transcriptional regulator [Azotobacter beijerinckii]